MRLGVLYLPLPFIASYRVAVVALNVTSMSVKRFDSIITFCVARRVLSNTIALSNMLRGENDNLIQGKKEVGVVVTV